MNTDAYFCQFEKSMSDIKQRMKDAGIKQTDLARYLGMPDSTLSTILAGKRRLRVETAREIASALTQMTGRAWSWDEILGKPEIAA